VSPGTLRLGLLGFAAPAAICSYLFALNTPDGIIATSMALIAVALVCRLTPSKQPLSTALPGPLVAVLALPLLQVIPLPTALWVRLTGIDAALLANLHQLDVSLLTTWSYQPVATLQSAAITLSTVAAFLISRHAARQTYGAAALVAALLALTCWQALQGLSQYVAAVSLTDGGDIAHGSFVNRGYYAAFLGGGLWLALGTVASQWRASRASANALLITSLSALTALAALSAIMTSLSRTALLVSVLLAFGAAWLLPKTIRRFALPALVTVPFGALFYAPELVTQQLNRFHLLVAQGGDPGRLLIWRDSLHVITRNPLGTGAATFPWSFERTTPYFMRNSVESAHSDYFEWAIEFGPVVAITIITVLVITLARAFLGAQRTTNPSKRFLALGATGGAVALTLHGLADSVLHTPATATLLAALLGLAFGLVGVPSKQLHRSGTALLATGLCACTLLLGGALRPLEPNEPFARARQAHLQGNREQARQEYLTALRLTPRAAPIWLALADLARSDGDTPAALHLAQVARSLEPYTYRVEWGLAGHQLAAGEIRPAVETLRTVCQQLPDLRPAAYLLAWRAGAPLDLIETRLTAAEPYAVGEYLAFLIRSGNLQGLQGAYERLVREQNIQLSVDHQRYLAIQGNFTPQ
jgi:tetratricopeptide (TPR) repeat protein